MIADLDTGALATAIRAREISPSQAVDAALSRIDEGAHYNAFITVCAETARAEAARLDAQWRSDAILPPLFGVPFSAKDLTATAGVRTTQGSKLFADTVPTQDAVAVARMKSAGAILIGKTTTPEFGHKPFTDSPLFGQTLNPWNEAHTCGGSSGGAAVAALLGMGPIALGTDGGGSIRIPAACCGIVGLKATLGAIPHLQVPDLFGANSYVGPMARTVADVTLAWSVLRGPDRNDPYGQSALPDHPAKPLKGLRVAWLPTCGSPAIDPDVARLTAAAAAKLAELGATITEITLDFASLEPAFLVLLQSALAARLGDQLRTRRADMAESLAITIEKGVTHSAVALQQAAAARSDIFRKLQAVFATHDLLVSPVTTAPALPLGQDPHGRVTIANHDAGTLRGAWYPFTYPMNVTGHPALSMPCGVTAAHLPVALQIAGPWHSEPTILATAAALEAALPPIRLRP